MNSIVDSDLAVQSYIDELLFVSDSALRPKVKPISGANSTGLNSTASNQSPPNHASQQRVLQKKALQEKASADIAISNVLDNLDVSEPESSQAENNPFVKKIELAQKRLQRSRRESNYPEWAAERFKCITFKVANLKLALPLAVVSGMYPLKNNLLQPVHLNSTSSPSANPSQITDNWLLGSMQLLPIEADGAQAATQIIDTAQLVMPERYSTAMTDNYRSVLTISGCNWAFAVDSVGGEVEFDAQKVRWRSAHTRREWLAGTVVDKMCAIVDIEVINRHLLADTVLGGFDSEDIDV